MIIRLKRVLAERAVAAHQQRHERPVRQRVRRALRVRHVRERQIRVAEDTADLVRRVGHLTGGGEQLFALRGEDVRRAAAQLLEYAAVRLQLRLGGVEELQRILGDGHQLGRGKRGSARDGNIAARGLTAHVLIEAVAGVLVALAARVAEQLRQTDAQRVLQAHPRQQILRAAAERPAEGGDLLGHGGERVILRAPRLVAREDVPQIPGQLLRHLAARENFLCIHIVYLRSSN